jgi:hypothetical protein
VTRVLLSFVFVVLVAHFALSWARVCCFVLVAHFALSWARVCCFCLSSVARTHLFVTSAGGFLVSCGCVAFLLSFLCMWHTGRCRGRVFLFVQGTTACYRLAAHLSAWMGGVSPRLVCFCMRRRFSRLHFQLKSCKSLAIAHVASTLITGSPSFPSSPVMQTGNGQLGMASQCSRTNT